MEDFIGLFHELPDEIKQLARKNYRLWKQDHRHPSLQFKQIHPSEPFYSVRIGRSWRALGFVKDEAIYFIVNMINF